MEQDFGPPLGLILIVHFGQAIYHYDQRAALAMHEYIRSSLLVKSFFTYCASHDLTQGLSSPARELSVLS